MREFKEYYQYVKSFFYIEGTDKLNLLGKFAMSILIIVLALFIAKVVTRIVFQKFLTAEPKRFKNVIGETTQGRTIASVVENTLRYLIYFFALLQILDLFNLGRSLTVGVAGIGGVAIGFGSQFIVRDFISGVFALMEDQYGIGDNVTINNQISGIVEQFGMRTTKIRGFDGSLTNIANGEINTVKNMSRSNQRAFVAMTVPQGLVLQEALDIVETIGDELEDNEDVTVKPSLFGVTDVGNFANVKVTVVGWAKAGKQYWLELEIRKRFVELCQERINTKDKGDKNEVQS
ncbi:mechanosensitive ion channel family protein [Lagierella sp.]|uniref:mechanosensitive ion channel family protein n=1 Tax=Lagierella sp. TaxID=2849657 RepID=UPI0026343DCA|nr:mechanosensitive ion channel family protein [Lagierella sp.]